MWAEGPRLDPIATGRKTISLKVVNFPTESADGNPMDPIASLSRAERMLLTVIKQRGPRAFVLVVALAAIAMSELITLVTLLLLEAPVRDVVVGIVIAVAGPAVVSTLAAASLCRFLNALTAATTDLQHLSRTDSLTGVLNRRAFSADAQALVASHADDVLVVAMVDIDEFKQVNDEHGHATGDLLLETLANDLEDALHDSGVLGRLGGDEFAVVALARDAAEAAALSARLNAACDLGAALSGARASIGSFVATEPTSLAQALAQADRALYDSKRDRVSGRP
jgi:diguanylate cyclase (GGDEF)-like protein